MYRTTKSRCRLALVATSALALGGCMWLDGGGPSRRNDGTTPLVEFLYGEKEIPPVAAEVHLNLPIRVAVSFLPEKGGAYVNSGAQAVDRDKVVNAIRERFKALPYVTEIVVVPSYYLSAGKGGGLTQLEQLSQLYKFDLFALVSYDQVLDRTLNKNSIAYLTVVGEFFVRGNRNETHTLIDLAVIDPRSRSLVLRSGGTSSLGGNVVGVGADNHATAQRAKGFELATAQLLDNFQRELTAFEARVKEGTAPVKVTRRSSGGGGGGSFDRLLLAMLAVAAGVTAIRASRGRRSSASARWSVPG